MGYKYVTHFKFFSEFKCQSKQSNLTNHYFSCILAVASTDAWWSRELRTDVRGVGRRVVSRTKGVVKSEIKDFFKKQKKKRIKKGKSKVKKLLKKGKKKAKKAVKKTFKKLKKVRGL